MTGIRTLALLCLLATPALAEPDTSSKTIAILTRNFEKGDPEIQKKVLREIGLLRSDEGIPFLASVALDDSLENEVRREGLKGMLAIDGAKYRAVLDPLKGTVIETSIVLSALLEIGDPRFAEIFVRRAAQKGLETRDVRAAVINTLDFWDGRPETRPPFRLWRGTKASEQLAAVAAESEGSRELRAVQALGWVRDRSATDTLIRLLSDENPRLTAVAIEGLGNPGRDASSALGRFLMKSKSGELRRLAVESLGKIRSKASRRALRAFRAKGDPEERSLVDGLLR